MKLSRRDFLVLLAAAGSSACVGDRAAQERTLELLGDWPDKKEEWTPTICRACPGGCGVLARAVDGRVVGLVGNPFHPVNRGAICARGLGELQTLYDPARLRSPLVRRDRESRDVTWEEALARVTRELAAARTRDQPERVAILHGELPSLRRELWERFARAFGTPNLISMAQGYSGHADVADRIIHGSDAPAARDWARADLVLSFSRSLLDGGDDLVMQHRQWAELRASGGRLIQLESRLSPTAARADDWIAIAPGTEAAIAIALCRLLMEREPFAARAAATPGFASWSDAEGRRQPGLADWLSSRGDVAWCEQVSGAPAARIESLADALADASRPLALAPAGWRADEEGLYASLAIEALNVLLGASNRDGGIVSFEPPPIARPETPPLDPVAQAGLTVPRADGAGRGRLALVEDAPEQLAERLTLEGEGPIDVLIVDGADPVRDLPNGRALAAALPRVGMVVCISESPNDTTEIADVVLPARHFLESDSDELHRRLPGGAAYSIARPAVEPAGDVRAAEEIIAALARGLGDPLANLFADTPREEVRRRAAGLHASRRGQIGLDPTRRQARASLTADREVKQLTRSRKRFERALDDIGVWFDASPPQTSSTATFGGPAFEALVLQRGAALDEVAAGLSSPEAVALPHYEGYGGAATEPTAPTADAGLPLVRFETAGLGATGSRSPWLHETLAPTSVASWHTWVELNPATGRALGLRHGQHVMLVSERDAIEARVALSETARPRYAYVPIGSGGAVTGQPRAEQGVSGLIAAPPDAYRGLPAERSGRVQIVPV